MLAHSRLRAAFLLLVLLTPASLLAQAPPAKPGEAKKEEEKKPPVMPEEKSSVTKHSITLDGQKIDYTATAANYLMKDEDGTPKAPVFFVAYTREGVKDPAERPVTFSFNGGRRAVRRDAQRLPAAGARLQRRSNLRASGRSVPLEHGGRPVPLPQLERGPAPEAQEGDRGAHSWRVGEKEVGRRRLICRATAAFPVCPSLTA